MTHRTDAVVIGAGVIGLACAARLARAGLETLLLERESSIGAGISSRNSEVIHAGLYYPADSLKAGLCRSGAIQLYRYCDERGVAYRKLGKLVVATESDQLEALQKIYARVQENGCKVTELSAAHACSLEPALRCKAALLSSETGIIDSHGLMSALRADLESAGGVLVFHAPVLWGTATTDGINLELADAEQAYLSIRYLVNAGGLDAPVIAAGIEGFPEQSIPRCRFAKGSYFTLMGRSPFPRLIYPVPEIGGLGIHLMLDMQGQARFGLDVEWVQAPDYKVDETKRHVFWEAIKRYWPGCELDYLAAGYAGVRPKLEMAGTLTEDFVIQSVESHGVHGLINLFGIESPGLTSCLAIAEEVMARFGLDSLESET